MPTTPAPTRFDDEQARKRGRRISRMFDRIAPTYDLLNHLLSANTDVRWRKRSARMLAFQGDERVLDLCCGTGDLAMAMRDGGAGSVVGTDFAPAMIEIAREKDERIDFRVADTTDLPFPDASFDAATVGFGVRNLEDLDAGFREACRVLKPGGRFLVLEFSRPPNPVFRAVYHAYFMIVLPMIGNLVSGGGGDNAYTYLPRSVLAFPGPEALADRLKDAGFERVDITSLTGGIACIHIAHKAT